MFACVVTQATPNCKWMFLNSGCCCTAHPCPWTRAVGGFGDIRWHFPGWEKAGQWTQLGPGRESEAPRNVLGNTQESSTRLTSGSYLDFPCSEGFCCQLLLTSQHRGFFLPPADIHHIIMIPQVDVFWHNLLYSLYSSGEPWDIPCHAAFL